MKVSVLRIAGKKTLEYLVPHSLRQIFRREHYFRVVKNFPEENERDLFLCSRIIRKGDAVVDIGANVGVYTKFFAKDVGHEGLVFSFEPIRDTFLVLIFIVKRLGLKNVRCHQTAISRENGIKKMFIPLDSAGSPNIYEAAFLTPGMLSKRAELVRSQRLDDALKDYVGKISFIKCDVEGHEKSVLEGAKKIINKYQPALLVEAKCRPECLSDILKPIKYKTFWSDGKSLWEITRRRPSPYENIFFLTHEHLRQLSRRGVEINFR